MPGVSTFQALRCGCDKQRVHREIGCKAGWITLCNIPIVGGLWRGISVLKWAKYWWRAQVKTNRLKICHWVIDISSKSSAWGWFPSEVACRYVRWKAWPISSHQEYIYSTFRWTWTKCCWHVRVWGCSGLLNFQRTENPSVGLFAITQAPSLTRARHSSRPYNNIDFFIARHLPL